MKDGPPVYTDADVARKHGGVLPAAPKLFPLAPPPTASPPTAPHPPSQWEIEEERRKKWLRDGRRETVEAPIRDEQLQTLVDAGKGRQVPTPESHLAEAQFAVLQRCAVCGKRQFRRHRH